MHHGMGWYRTKRETWSSYLPESWPGDRQWRNSCPLHRSSSETACCATFRTSSSCAHTARATTDFLQHLNPIEHLWDEIQRRLNEEQPKLSVAFQRVWARIPIVFINRLVNSMYRRCAAVINAGGGHTRY
jgi:hypothetical protein